ncbi:class I SAM-dependent methyltransferase [Steroidobacter flavus]|uniref:Class I SAM-dependent methyltransferase n=1 Tax=Steroidobacter flavus TaxID=1842136 RepID=A0ABV8T1B9_9GAMM
MPSMEENVARVAAYYQARAHEYHETTGYHRDNVDAGYARLKEQHQAAFAGHDVLEIACGTGYWTAVIAATARSVVATDVHTELVQATSERLRRFPNVRCQVADAYTLDTVQETFSAAFAQYWWSHIPRAMCPVFLRALHSKLRPGAFVSFSDNLEYQAEWVKRRVDEHGDNYEERSLRDGTRFETVKNFPTKAEFEALLDGVAEDVTFLEQEVGDIDGPARLWTVSYRLKG